MYACEDNFVGAIRNALNSRQNALRPCVCVCVCTFRNKFQWFAIQIGVEIASRISIMQQYTVKRWSKQISKNEQRDTERWSETKNVQEQQQQQR